MLSSKVGISPPLKRRSQTSALPDRRKGDNAHHANPAGRFSNSPNAREELVGSNGHCRRMTHDPRGRSEAGLHESNGRSRDESPEAGTTSQMSRQDCWGTRTQPCVWALGGPRLDRANRGPDGRRQCRDRRSLGMARPRHRRRSGHIHPAAARTGARA
jgi:hypothetical protein